MDFEGENTLKSASHNNLSDDVYPDAVLNIARETASVFQLKRRWEKKPTMLDLSPDFQRGLVWSSKKKSELIESILMGIPLPALYVKEDENGVYIVVDGKQRLSTLFDFIDGKFRLENLAILRGYVGKSFSKLSALEQNKIEDYSLIVNVIKAPTSDRVTFDLFDRVNRGGVQLNNQEMRNALYQGNATKLINELAKESSFKEAIELTKEPKRMKDRYLVLRFLAFYMLKEHCTIDIDSGSVLQYKSNLEDFLGKTMRFLNSLNENDELFVQLRDMFVQTMETAVRYVIPLGGFRLPSAPGKSKRPLNMAFFESFGYFLAKRGTDLSQMQIKSFYRSLLEDGNYLYSLTHSVDSLKQINIRFNTIDHLITGSYVDAAENPEL